MRQYLKDLRTNKSVTQTETAKAIGISQNYYSTIENGLRKNSLDLRLLFKISGYFGVELQWLINQELNFINKKGA